MLFNFCDPRLRPEIECSTVSTEGYEVSNLINDSDKGFLAYASIKPPVNIDITFLCNVSINHIVIWPCVGSQKSSGFQVYARTSNDHSIPYTLLANGFLNKLNAGLVLYQASVNHETLSVPGNFLKRYIKPSLRNLVTYTNNLRICICKTDNSVPALGRIEVWGKVSSKCGKDTVASIYTLWYKQEEQSSESVEKNQDSASKSTDTFSDEKNAINSSKEPSLEVPECFLDAITYEIMTQPILLPSGKIIDQTTLQKHEESEALWGRKLSDPFTGIPFSENRKPLIASALKTRIDKFLLENSNAEEIKRLPRVLGRALSSKVEEVAELPKYVLEETVFKDSSNSKPKSQPIANTQGTKFCHKLPVAVMSHKRTAITVPKATKKTKIESSEAKRDPAEDNVNAASNSRLNCTCCSNATYYALPCKHVICRKKLTSVKDSRCTSCDAAYKTSEVIRVYN